MSKVYFVMPAYNEAENIAKTIEQWHPVVERCGSESRLVIANDGSRDNTYEIMRGLQTAYPQLVALDKPNSGHGGTVLYLYRYAIENQADYIFQTDSDGQTNPDEFGAFWDVRTEYDAVIGNRTVRGDGKDRKFVENTVCFLLRLVFGVKVKDANAPFRLMKTDVVKKYIDKLPTNFNLPNIMLTTYFVYFHQKVKFVEITFRPRQAGTNSINIKRIVKIGWHAMFDFINLRRDINK